MVPPFLSRFIHCLICCSYSLYDPTWFLNSYHGLSIVSSVALIVYTSPHGSSNRLWLVFRLWRCHQLCAYLVPFYVPILFYCHPSYSLYIVLSNTDLGLRCKQQLVCYLIVLCRYFCIVLKRYCDEKIKG
jgi:hypothetical protein